jgi:hypothetical protein
MECWSDGIEVKASFHHSITPILQYSNTPSLQHSIILKFSSEKAYWTRIGKFYFVIKDVKEYDSKRSGKKNPCRTLWGKG